MRINHRIFGLLAGVLFGLLTAKAIAQTWPGRDDQQLQEQAVQRLGAMPWFHRKGTDKILEVLDSSDVFSAQNAVGQVTLLLTTRNDQDNDLCVKVRLFVPVDQDDSKRILAEKTFWVTLVKDVTLKKTLDVHLNASMLAWLANQPAEFALSAIGLEAEFTTNAGKPVKYLVNRGYLGFAHRDQAQPPSAAVESHNGVPMLRINDRYYPANFGYVGWNWIPCRQSLEDFGKRGRHVYEIVLQPWVLWKDGRLDPTVFEAKMNQIVNSIVGRDPQALLFVRWWLYVPRDWSEHYPGQSIVYDDGSQDVNLLGGQWNHASYASEQWKQQYSEIVREATQRLVHGPYADRVFAVRVGYGNCGEWNNFGYHQQKFPGYSPQMRQRYQQWLQSEYKDLHTLNKVWHTTFNAWEQIEVPSRLERLNAEYGVLRDPAVSGNYRDFYRFTSDLTVELIEHFGHIVKDASDGRLLYGAFYGYFSHHLTCPPYHSLDSGHYALGKLLKSPVVDLLCSPYNYADRQQNIGLGIALDSIKLHGKLFWVEVDLPTHDTDVQTHPNKKELFCSTAEDTISYYWRDYARIATWGVGGYWYDFAHDWYEGQAFLQLAQKVHQANALLQTSPAHSKAQVAVILDEPSVFYLSSQSGQWGKDVYNLLAYKLDFTGSPWDCYLSSDIDAVARKGYKLIVFVNQLALTSQVTKALDGYNGSVLWLYGAGQIRDGQLQATSDATGIKLQSDLNKPFATYCVDPTAKVLQQRDHKTIFASKPRKGGDSYYYHQPDIGISQLQAVYRASGIQAYVTADNTACYINSSLIAVWQPKSDGKPITMTLPSVADWVVDLWDYRRVPTEGGRTWEIVPEKDRPFIKLYYYGNTQPTEILK